MNTRLITDVEIAQRQTDIRTDAYQARHSFTIAGVRQLIGNTFIALGMRLHGRGEKCRETPVSAHTAAPARGL